MTTAPPATEDLRDRAHTALRRIGVTVPDGGDLRARTPITGDELAGLAAAGAADVDEALTAARAAFLDWRTTPAPISTRRAISARPASRSTNTRWKTASCRASASTCATSRRAPRLRLPISRRR